MPPNKERLYVVLGHRHPPPKVPTAENQFHWSLLIGPKNEEEVVACMHFEIKRALEPGPKRYSYTEEATTNAASDSVLARLLVGKIEDRAVTEAILRDTPLRQGDKSFNSMVWVQETLARLQRDPQAVGTHRQLDWTVIRDQAIAFAQTAAANPDRANHAHGAKVPTLDLVEGDEFHGA